MQRKETQLVFRVYGRMCVCVCVPAWYSWGGRQVRSWESNTGDKWDRIERVPARPYNLDPASWKKKSPENCCRKRRWPPDGHWWLPFSLLFYTSHRGIDPGQSANTNTKVYSYTCTLMTLVAFLNHSMFL